jgi:hypothetical protein
MYFDVAKIHIWGDGEDSKSKPRMVFGFRDGNPRITVYTGQTGPESVISFPADVPTMVMVLTYMKDIAKAPPGAKVIIESLTLVYQDNKPTQEKKVVSTLYVGKSKDGLVYLSVITEGKPKLIFTIKSSPFHTFRDGDKNVLDGAKVSETMAIGIADIMLNAISQTVLQYSHDEYNTGVRTQTSVGKRNDTNSNAGKGPVLQDLDEISL